MKKRVIFAELPLFSGVIPLASGYMEAVCRQDRSLRDAVTFTKVSLSVKSRFSDIMQTLVHEEGDIYAFSCYVWNIGLIKRLLDSLHKVKPTCRFVLGGPQVMHHAERYLPSEIENAVVCNGEGERTFANYLRAVVLTDAQDLSRVPG